MILLMDEPFSGLDPLAKKKTQALIQKIANMDELNTIIIVTHDIVAAATVSDHLWMMGRDHDPTGACIPGAYIVKTHNLIDLGYAWTDDPSNNPSFPQFIKELESEFVGL
jgi:energy-coupling factor transporter ATP-binding protein EcfA2